jgi:benzoate transport
MSISPKEILDKSPMNAFQILAVGVCILLNALDGFDVLAISFASPGIAAEWSINRAELGVVLSMELIGMAIGSVFLGGVADKIGRRPTIIACLIVMAVGMYGASLVHSVNQLLVVRLITGLGIGGMLASINAVAAEFSNAKYRNLSVMLMAAGYPVGAVLGGSVASQLLVNFDWRVVFEFGAAVTALALIIVYFMLPESIEYLLAKRPDNALANINKTLIRMGHQTVDVLPEKSAEETIKPSIRQLFTEKYAVLTITLTLAYFLHIMSFYYIIKWIPKLVVDMNYAASSAGQVLVWANLGGALGAFIVGMIASKLDLRKVTIAVMLLSFVMITYFGLGHKDLTGLAIVAAVAGFFTNSAIVGLYAMFAQYFPSTLRATGTGFVIGTGRAGAALGPMIAGYLFANNFSLMTVSVAMGCGALFAGIALMTLKKK